MPVRLGEMGHPPPVEADEKVALIVDDEPVVLQLMRRVVEQAGHTVLTAADGDEACAVAEQAPSPITVAVFDATIPPSGAAPAAERVLALHPDAALVMTSGASLAAPEQRCIDLLGGHFLAKPFAPRALVALIEELRTGAGRS